MPFRHWLTGTTGVDALGGGLFGAAAAGGALDGVDGAEAAESSEQPASASSTVASTATTSRFMILFPGLAEPGQHMRHARPTPGSKPYLRRARAGLEEGCHEITAGFQNARVGVSECFEQFQQP